jgi:hypothetical protein
MQQKTATTPFPDWGSSRAKALRGEKHAEFENMVSLASQSDDEGEVKTDQKMESSKGKAAGKAALKVPDSATEGNVDVRVGK